MEDDSVANAAMSAEIGFIVPDWAYQGATLDGITNVMWAAYRFKDAVPPQPPKQLAVTQTTINAVSLSWQKPDTAADGDYPKYYIIKRNGMDAGVTSALTFTDKYLTAASLYDYAVYSVDDSSNVNKLPAVIEATTLADNAAPKIDQALTADLRTVEVVFTEAVSKATAEVAGNYTISGGVTVSSATLSATDSRCSWPPRRIPRARAIPSP